MRVKRAENRQIQESQRKLDNEEMSEEEEEEEEMTDEEGGCTTYMAYITISPFNSQIRFVILLTFNHTIPLMLVQRSWYWIN